MDSETICHFAQEYLDKANAFRDIGDYFKEYANLNTSCAMYLLSLHCSDLQYAKRSNVITVYEALCKRQEEVDLGFNLNSPSRKKKNKIEVSEVPLQELFFHEEDNGQLDFER